MSTSEQLFSEMMSQNLQNYEFHTEFLEKSFFPWNIEGAKSLKNYEIYS